MPGWRGEQYPAPSAEELEREHPRLYAQMQRHNEIWERAWRYYNLDLKDAQAFGVEKKARDEAEAEARALAASMAPEAADDYDEYGDVFDDETPKKSKKGKKGGKKGGKKSGANVASLTLSLRSAAASVEGAFERARRTAARRPTMAALRAEARARAERRGTPCRSALKRGAVASLSLSPPARRGKRALDDHYYSFYSRYVETRVVRRDARAAIRLYVA